jgi:HemY protein
LDDCHDSGQLQASWQLLLPEERKQVDVAMHAAQRLLTLEGEPTLALKWLLPVWQELTRMPETGSALQRQRLVKVLARAMDAMAPESEWLARVEQARLANPRSMELQYLSGMVCLRHGLWGKAQQMLEQVAPRITDKELQRQAWRALAELAEQKGRADGEYAMSAKLHEAAEGGDARAALEILKHAHGWVAKQQVQIDVAQ